MKKEEKKRKMKLRWQVKVLIIITFIILYSFFIETKGVFIKEYKIETNKINKEMHGLKIVQFSDLHFGSSVNEKMVSNVVKKINETKPDVIIFTGDLIDERHKLTSEEKDYLINKLSKINAELGKYYVSGEEDNENATSILNLSGFINLKNKEQLVYLNSSNPILIMSKETAENYFNNYNDESIFKILVLHNPDDIKKLKNYDIDLALAGHTHNGQINIPKVKDLLIDSDYKKNYQKVNNIKLFVNPGIGTSKINARLFNHPTIYLFRLNKTSN